MSQSVRSKNKSLLIRKTILELCNERTLSRNQLVNEIHASYQSINWHLMELVTEGRIMVIEKVSPNKSIYKAYSTIDPNDYEMPTERILHVSKKETYTHDVSPELAQMMGLAKGGEYVKGRRYMMDDNHQKASDGAAWTERLKDIARSQHTAMPKNTVNGSTLGYI